MATPTPALAASQFGDISKSLEGNISVTVKTYIGTVSVINDTTAILGSALLESITKAIETATQANAKENDEVETAATQLHARVSLINDGIAKQRSEMSFIGRIVVWVAQLFGMDSAQDFAKAGKLLADFLPKKEEVEGEGNATASAKEEVVAAAEGEGDASAVSAEKEVEEEDAVATLQQDEEGEEVEEQVASSWFDSCIQRYNDCCSRG